MPLEPSSFAINLRTVLPTPCWKFRSKTTCGCSVAARPTGPRFSFGNSSCNFYWPLLPCQVPHGNLWSFFLYQQLTLLVATMPHQEEPIISTTCSSLNFDWKGSNPL